MRDELITFDTAKLAKEKGFNTIQRYGNEASLYTKKGKHTYYSNYGFMYSGLSDGYISAPTQSLLQKYLRKIHKIDVEAPLVYKLNTRKYLVRVYKNNTEIILPTFHYYKSYEEALEIALYQALNLIK